MSMEDSGLVASSWENFMTDAEIEYGIILAKIKRAEQEKITLEAKAKRIGACIAAFGASLQNYPANKIYKAGQDQHGNIKTEPVPAEVMSAMRDWEQSFDIADKLRRVNWDLSNLKMDAKKFEGSN